MALGVSGINANGRVSASGAVTITGGILIPPESAGIGDLIYKNGSTIKVVHRGTATGTTVTVGSTSYTLWGCIFGFVAGMAMVVSPNAGEAGSLQWATSSPPSWLNKYYGSGTTLMRNGLKTTDYYAQMNTAQQMSSDSYRGTAGSNVHPTQAYNGNVMTESTYNSNTNNVKRYYGTWKEYLRQTLRVNGAPGTCFGAVFDGCKVHEYGRYVTNRIGSDSAYPAVKHCYDYQGSLGTDAKGTWWLPSMFELGELMIDEHWDKVHENSAVLDVSKGVGRWSSVLVPGSVAWVYGRDGMSGGTGVAGSYSNLVTRPVTLLKLV